MSTKEEWIDVDVPAFDMPPFRPSPEALAEWLAEEKRRQELLKSLREQGK